jgi:hypothetical protein
MGNASTQQNNNSRNSLYAIAGSCSTTSSKPARPAWEVETLSTIEVHPCEQYCSEMC